MTHYWLVGSVCTRRAHAPKTPKLARWSLLIGLLASLPCQAQEKPTTPAAPQPTKEARLAVLLTGSKFIGHFSIDGAAGETDGNKSETAFQKEEYEIRKATKLPTGNLWIIEARIHYGEHDLTVPIPIPIEWAGETAVFTLDHVTIPGLGTFDARVLIDGTRYAGTWQHDDRGGHLFGTITAAKQKGANGIEPDGSKQT